MRIKRATDAISREYWRFVDRVAREVREEAENERADELVAEATSYADVCERITSGGVRVC